MMDCLTPTPYDVTGNRFRFTSSSIDSSSKLSVDTLGQSSPLETLQGHRNIGNRSKSYLKNNNNKTKTNKKPCVSVSSSEQRSNHSSSDSSGGSSVNSVFYRTKDGLGNEYVRGPFKISRSKTPQRLCPNGSAKGNDMTSCLSLKPKLPSEEVTYTVTDELDDSSNQVVFLPPPPTDIDSDNDSVGGCDIGGPCSPRHHDWRSSGDLSKSPTYRGRNHGNNRCLCCMLLVFVLSTVGLSAVLVLMYLGKLQLPPIPSIHSYNGEERALTGEGAMVKEVCESPVCLKTSSSILSRMNASGNPCENFYNYACGGYIKEVDLSWFQTRIRESPEEIIQEHRKFIIDRLCASFKPTDDKLLASAKDIYRSCLFRPISLDERTKSVVTEVLETLGGLIVPNDASDLTMLLANVTRMFGASPFFKVIVHSSKNLSLVSKVTQYMDPWSPPREYKRARTSTKQTDGSVSRSRLNELLIQLIGHSTNESEARNIVAEFLRLEAHIHRILNTGREQTNSNKQYNEQDVTCDSANNKKTMVDLQVKFNGFGIDWITFFQNVLESADVSEIKLCKVKLSLELQHLLKITPRSSLRQFIILHTLVHSDLFILFTNNYQQVSRSHGGDMKPATPEEHCLDLLLHFMPSLEKFSGCDDETLLQNRANAFGTLRNIRSALYTILTSSLKVPKDNAALVTNTSMKPVMDSISEVLVTRCQSTVEPLGPFDEYSFNTNMLRIIQHHHGEYFRGRLWQAPGDLELSALWISTSIQGNHRVRAGPVVYPSPVPQPILYGSLGLFMAYRVADGLGIEGMSMVPFNCLLDLSFTSEGNKSMPYRAFERMPKWSWSDAYNVWSTLYNNDLLDHHADGLLNHSVVLNLAVRLKCLVQMYGNMEILGYGVQVYKVDEEQTKGLRWKDQLAMKLSYQAWKQLDSDLEADHFIPGLAFTRPQMFFISFAQAHCEKVSERGIREHYISSDIHHSIPSEQRVNGVLRNSDEFSQAFQCSDNTYMSPLDKCRIFG